MAAFKSILCAVNGSRASASAVRRAIALASPGAELGFLAVVWRVGVGSTQRAALAPERGEQALRDAAALAAASQVRCECVLEHAADPAPAILRHARDHDLLVLGAPATLRATGILSGSVASAMAHRAPVPVLLARGDTAPFPRQIVVASDGSQGGREAVRLAAGIARSCEAKVTLAYADEAAAFAGLPPAVTEHSALLCEHAGVAPEVVIARGRAQHAIIAVATDAQADLLVIGSRGLRGTHALGSVSERVAHEAPLSVLVVRPEPVLPLRPELVAPARGAAIRVRDRALAERVAWR
jgi:nucleotide-binding universal stress UspA family protein